MAKQSIASGAGLNQQPLSARTFYSRVLIATLFASVRLLPYGVRSDIPANAGQTIDWRKYSRLAAAGALTEGSPPSATNLVKSNVQAVVGQYGDFIEWTDVFVDTTPDPDVAQAKMLQGEQIGLTYDTLIQTELLNGSNVVYAGNASSTATVDSADVVDAADFDLVIKNLQNRHVPPVTSFIPGSSNETTVTGLPAYIGFLNPDTLSVVRAISGFNSVETYQGQTVILPGEMGKYRDIRFVMQSNSLVQAGAGASSIDVHFIPIMGAGAFGVSGIGGQSVKSMDRATDTPESGDELGQSGSVGWKGYFVSKILDNDKLERIETAA